MEQKKQMGVSFKVSKVGKRYRPKVFQVEDVEAECGPSTSVVDTQQRLRKGNFAGKGEKAADHVNVFARSGMNSVAEDIEVSFSLNLFPNGFSVGKPSELFTEAPKVVHPYNGATRIFFSAIECGWLPGDVFDNISCNYVNGALLCEIRDYRNCLYRRSKASADKSPVVCKVLLQMCMENVIKDILSISNDSWTYKDLLEVESFILKALQPDLHLNPEPFQDRYGGEPMTMKLDLGVTWGSKRRKLSDAPAGYPRFSSENDRVVPSPQLTTLKSCPVVQKSNATVETAPQLNHLAMLPINKLVDSRNQSAVADLSSLNPSSVPVQYYNECNNATIETCSLKSSPVVQKSKVTVESAPQFNHLTVGPINQLVDSRNQSVVADLSSLNPSSAPMQCYNECNSAMIETSSLVCSEQGTCKTREIQIPLLRKPKREPLDFSYQQPSGSQLEIVLEAELLQKQKKALSHRPPEAKRVLHERFHVNRGLSPLANNGQQAILAGIPKLHAGMPIVKQEPAETSNFTGFDVKKIKDNYSAMNMRCNRSNISSSQILGTNVPHSSLPWNLMLHDQNVEKEVVTQKRKIMQNPHIMAGVSIAPVTSYQNESLQRETSVSAKQKKNSRSKGLNTKTSGSLVTSSNTNAISGSRLQSRNFTLFQMSEVKANLERFHKIRAVTQRYGLNKKKHKLDNILLGKPSFNVSQLVADCLSNSQDNRRLKNAPKERTPQSECFSDWNFNVARTRTLKFMHRSHIQQESRNFMVNEACVRLVMSKKLNEGLVEAKVLHGYEKGIDLSDFPLLPTFPRNLHFAKLFAAQFSSLMEREGYFFVTECIEPPVVSDGCTSTQQITNVGAVTRALGASVQQHWQILNKRAHLHFQMMQRQILQQELMQRMKMVGDLGVMGGMSMLEFGGGMQGHGNVMGMGGCFHVPMGGQVPWINNAAHLASSSGRMENFGANFDSKAAVMTQLMSLDGQGRAMINEYPYMRNLGAVPSQPPDDQDMAYLLANQHFSWSHASVSGSSANTSRTFNGSPSFIVKSEGL